MHESASFLHNFKSNFLVTLLVLIAVFVLSVQSCRSVQPFKVAPEASTHKIEAKSDYETTWKTVVGFCSDNGMTFKAISKPDGIITAEKPFCKLTYLKSGKPADSLSWVVAERIIQNGSGKYFNPTQGIIEWNILISSDGSTGSTVRINLKTPILVTNTRFQGSPVEERREYKSNAFSTKRFEEQLTKRLIP